MRYEAWITIRTTPCFAIRDAKLLKIFYLRIILLMNMCNSICRSGHQKLSFDYAVAAETES